MVNGIEKNIYFATIREIQSEKYFGGVWVRTFICPLIHTSVIFTQNPRLHSEFVLCVFNVLVLIVNLNMFMYPVTLLNIDVLVDE